MTDQDAEPIREISLLDRAMVAGIAGNLIEAGFTTKGDALIRAVRCCDEFPECSHMLAWIENRATEQVSA